ncbi:hypothetical protein CHU93_09805 [Sandarakinorhabdus cyanobacteriorum]|uniref:peptidylprolyl isomerase n=1 Tax=Sandarakinorhabdus cyanobacteriorum TaxID=1981098 RepID=A0A255YF11_9SPHN|nr:hypothetical protein CHU93_09805 [Sandarakinorhabdus cyanobacteriorum]
MMKQWRVGARSLLREPLLHFFIAGAAVFGLMAGRGPDVGDRRIVVDEAVVAGIVAHHLRAFRRPPTAAELDDLIRDHVRTEIYYREALALGLDQDDDAVKKRLRNKMLAIASARAEARTPTDAELQALIDRNPARYARPVRYWLEQRFLGDDTPATRAAATAMLGATDQGKAPAATAPALPLPARLSGTPADEVAMQFGDDFAAGLARVPTGRWAGPVASGFGLHLVRVERRVDPPRPTLADVRQRVENDWRRTAIAAAEEADLKALMAKYDVVIEPVT